MKRHGVFQNPAAYTGKVSEAAPSPTRTANAQQAQLLLDVTLRPMLSLLMAAPRSARQVAEPLKVNLQRAYYLLRKLKRAGIAEVTRDGPSRRYQVAPRWFIPYEVTRADTLQALMGDQIMPRMAQFVTLSVGVLQRQQSDWGAWLELGPLGSTLSIGDTEGAAHQLFTGAEPIILNIGNVHLTRSRAEDLKRRLLAVMDDLEEQHSPDADEYSFAVMLVRGDVG